MRNRGDKKSSTQKLKKNDKMHGLQFFFYRLFGIGLLGVLATKPLGPPPGLSLAPQSGVPATVRSLRGVPFMN